MFKILVVEDDKRRVEYAKGVADGSRRLADMMNILKLNIMQGEISVESVLGKGSTFTVKFRRI